MRLFLVFVHYDDEFLLADLDGGLVGGDGGCQGGQQAPGLLALGEGLQGVGFGDHVRLSAGALVLLHLGRFGPALAEGHDFVGVCVGER